MAQCGGEGIRCVWQFYYILIEGHYIYIYMSPLTLLQTFKEVFDIFEKKKMLVCFHELAEKVSYLSCKHTTA